MVTSATFADAEDPSLKTGAASLTSVTVIAVVWAPSVLVPSVKEIVMS